MKALAFALLLLVQDSRTEDALPRALKSITPDSLKPALTYLASDELEGRLAGCPGNDKATQYIAERFKEAGLKPVGDDGTYFQHFEPVKGVRTRNCVGLLEGTDLKDQIIIVGAHHDHVGRKGQRNVGQMGRPTEGDEIWNGADDNASGTTALLALAKALAESGLRPRRSLLFITFSAEEWGLLGSKHYVDHPIFPLHQTSLMINMDMVGRGDPQRDTPFGGLATVSGETFRDAVRKAAAATGLKVSLIDAYGGSSDHASFAAKKIPVIAVHENGPCPDYHKVTDHADKINFEYMAQLTRTVLLVLLNLANLDTIPGWNPDFKPVREESKPRIGVSLETLQGEELKKLGLGEGERAFRVTTVYEGTVGDRAGLKEGDIIVKFDGAPFVQEDALSELRGRLDKVEREKEYELEILRGGERKVFKLRWPKE